MNIQELKEAILNDSLYNMFLVLECEKDTFIADQYVDTICEIKGIDKTFAESVTACISPVGKLFSSNKLFVVKTDCFSEMLSDYSILENVIVVCNSIDKKIKAQLSEYTIEIPKVLPWQAVVYINKYCNSLPAGYAEWLFEACNNDMYKVQSELDKLLLFDGKDRADLANILRWAPDSDLYAIDAFKLADLLVKNDKNGIKDFLLHAFYCDIEPLALVALTLRTFKNILFTLYSAHPEAAGLSSKQIWYIKNNYSSLNCPIERVMRAIHALSNVDNALKSGKLDLSKQLFIEYIICNLI